MEDNIKIDLKEIFWQGVESTGQEHVAGCCGHGDEPSVSVS